MNIKRCQCDCTITAPSLNLLETKTQKQETQTTQKMFKTIAAVALVLCVATAVPVRLVALDYISGHPLSNSQMQWLENGTTFITDSEGVAEFDAEVGANLTINFPGDATYHQTQSTTVIVPPEGLTTLLNQMVMQIPSHILYDVFFLVVPGKKNDTACQVVVTVCNVNKTVYDHAQGLPGTVAVLDPPMDTKTFYFGTWGKLSNDTNPLPNNLNSTSFDGGVIFENIPVNPDQWYVVSAFHEGYEFTQSYFRCTQEGSFINGAPNLGPRATRIHNFWH